MTEQTPSAAGHAPESLSPAERTAVLVRAGLNSRHRKEKRFKAYGIAALGIAVAILVILLGSIFIKGAPAFSTTTISVPVTLDAARIDAEQLDRANFRGVVYRAIDDLFPDVTSRRDKRAMRSMFSSGAGFALRDAVLADPSLIGQTFDLRVPASSDIDQLAKGNISKDVPEQNRRVSDMQITWFESLEQRGLVNLEFNTRLFTNGDSREPELAGIKGALMGSLFTLAVTLILSFPIGVSAAVYLEEFAPKNRWTDMIEVNINNLAAVPSIVFGLLGLAVFLNFFELPRSAPLVGGMVLMLMTLPTIIIASRAALKSVPPSIREAALGIGASRLQVVWHHVLPLAMPGMLTGTIIGMAQALGETAPLLMIGMVAFVVDIPGGVMDPSTVLPVQIFLWADAPERAFVERTSAAIIVLLMFLVAMNALAVWLRKKFERKW